MKRVCTGGEKHSERANPLRLLESKPATQHDPYFVVAGEREGKVGEQGGTRAEELCSVATVLRPFWTNLRSRTPRGLRTLLPGDLVGARTDRVATVTENVVSLVGSRLVV